MPKVERFEVICVGGGSGLTAAYYAEEEGRKTALVERRTDRLGGTCVNVGCIPSKGLIQAAEVMKTIRSAERFGITLDQSSIKVDLGAIFDRVRDRRAQGNQGTKKWVDGSFTPIYDEVRFVGDKTLETKDGQRRSTADRIFLAVGARAVVPPIPDLDRIRFYTNEDIFDLKERPGSVVILGGGYIGVEFAHFFAELGTRVAIIESSSCLLREDHDVRRLFTQELRKKVDLHNDARAVRAIAKDGLQGFIVADNKTGDETEVLGDIVLIAVGRRPNTDGLDLAKTGVETDDKGWIRVDDRLRTTHPDIYAYGDCIGQGMFKHTSSFEGEVAYRNAFGADLVMDYTANPHAIFSDPQIGAVGKTEKECQDEGLDYKVVKKEYGSIAKGQIIGDPPGFAKLILENGTDRILGFHVIGPGAADLVHEVVVAMTAEGRSADLVRRAIHIHPTMPELIHSVFTAAAGSPFAEHRVGLRTPARSS